MDCVLSELNSVQGMFAWMKLLFGKYCRKVSIHSLNILLQIKLLEFFLICLPPSFMTLLHCTLPAVYHHFLWLYGDWETSSRTGMIQPQNRWIQKLTSWYFFYISPAFLICLSLLALEWNSSVPQICCPASLFQCRVPERYTKKPFDDSGFFFFHSTQYGHGVNGSNTTMVTVQGRL